jgi:hypothetical protein
LADKGYDADGFGEVLADRVYAACEVVKAGRPPAYNRQHWQTSFDDIEQIVNIQRDSLCSACQHIHQSDDKK